MTKQATIKRIKSRRPSSAVDIAKLAGVSTSAVYMSLRGDPAMNPDTRERVLAVARHLNYRPKASARALATGRSDMVGVVFASTEMQRSSYWFSQYAAALEMISECLDARDFVMSLVTWSDEREELLLPRLFRESGVDGLIVLNTPETPVLERMLHHHGKPYVALDSAPARDRITVAVNELRAAEMAVEHLVNLGHRRIAYIPLPDEAKPSVEFTPLRQEMFPRGYVRGMATAGFPPIPGWDQPQVFADFLQKLWNDPNPPTALITYNDSVALDAIHWLNDRGLSVPRDVSLVGLQYTGVADQCSGYSRQLPGITCKASMQREMAKVGVEKLLEQIEFPDASVESAFIDPVIDIRMSTGPRAG